MIFRNKLFKGILILSAPVSLFFVVFLRLDKDEQPEEADVIIVPEGATIRAYQAVDLLQDGYSRSDQVIISPGTEYNIPSYLEAGAEKDQLFIEEDATSTWTNATNSVEVMEENSWESALVVTTDYHTRRTRLSFERAAFGKDMDFTYVSTYLEDDTGEPLGYLDHRDGWRTGLRETGKYFGYLFGLYHMIDLD